MIATERIVKIVYFYYGKQIEEGQIKVRGNIVEIYFRGEIKVRKSIEGIDIERLTAQEIADLCIPEMIVIFPRGTNYSYYE